MKPINIEIKPYNSVFALFLFLFLLYFSIRNANKNDKNAAIADHNSGDKKAKKSPPLLNDG